MGDQHSESGATTAAGAVAVVDGIARFAAVAAELPAARAGSLGDDEGRVAELLARGWDLAAFTPTGALLLEVLDAAGARVEVVQGASATWGRRRGAYPGSGGEGELSRASSHAPAVAAWGAPPGRRVTAMGLVPGPDGDLLRASCGLVLRLPAAAVDGVVRVAWMLAWHAAMHAAERRVLPADGRLAGALEALALEVGIPRALRERVAWADALASQVVTEIGLEG